MKLKRNSLTTLLVVSFLLMALSGCGQQAEPDSAQPPLETVTYSNLTDADSRKLLNEALADANVDETRTKLLLDRVDQFNASVKSEWLTGGFESAAPTETRYDPYEMQDLWTEKNGSFPGYNCRITAFSLFGEFVTAGVDQPETQGEDSLFMDLETLAADPAVLCGDSTSKFCALFAPVTAADTTEVADQVKALQAGWSERGISFEDSSARLISVVLHDRFSDTDNTLFIGHVGVLLPAEDGSLYFIEKVAFQEPYRLVKIQNRTELSDYLMEKYDTAWGQDTTRSFIMENDELMDGYRPNPLDSAFDADREAGKDILEVRGISKTIDGEKVLDNVSFIVRRGDKIAFISDNELAMTTLFQILMGEMKPDEGSFKWGVTTSQSYFPKDNNEFFEGHEENMLDWIAPYSRTDTLESTLRGFLGRMLFSGDDVYKPVRVLSGGEKVRLMLARMMLFGSNVLVIDQPTNHLDLESITAVNNGVRDFKGTVLFASHDHEFVQTIATRIIEIREKGVLDKECTYDEFLEFRETYKG